MNSGDNNQEQEIPICKVVLIGPTSVGKTSLINRFSSNIFSDVVMSTTGASYATVLKEIGEEKRSIKFELWDTIGQERFIALSRLFYKEASIVILVYDITSKKSFIEMKNVWLNEINNYIGQHAILAIAANKADLYEKEEVDEDEAKQLAKEINAQFQSTSAKDAYGVDHLFNKVGLQFLNPTIEQATLEIERSKRNTVQLLKGDQSKFTHKNCC